MAHHFTKSTVEASAWCKRCEKPTQHRIDNGRLGPCLVCIAALEKSFKDGKPAPAKEQKEMFDV